MTADRDQHYYATFTGVQSVMGANFCITHGASPSYGTIRFLPQESTIPSVGEFAIWDKNGRRVLRFRDCQISRPSIDGDESGTECTLYILDRRWRWRDRHVTGHFNPRRQDGTIFEHAGWTKKSAREIVQAMFQILNEPAPDLSEIPDTDYPELNLDHEPIPPVLNALLEQYGCRLAWTAEDNPIVVKYGRGRDLPPPDDGALHLGQSVDASQLPDRVGLLGGPIRFEAIWECEPLAQETDGSIKGVDNVSYRPAGGWGTTDPHMLPAVTDMGDRNYAVSSVYRMYRIKRAVGGDDANPLLPFGVLQLANAIDIPQPITIRHMQLEPVLTDYRVVLDGFGRTITEPAPAECYVYSQYWGDHYRRSGGNKWRTYYSSPFAGASTASIEEGAPSLTFSLDSQRGIVHFGTPQFVADADHDEIDFALVYIRCVCTLLGTVFTPIRFEKYKNLNPPQGGSGDLLIHDDAVWPYWKPEAIIPEHDVSTDPDETPYATSYDTNVDIVNKAADERIQAKIDEIVPHPISSSGTYAEILPIGTDGALQQVSWSVGPGGFETHCSRNSQTIQWVERYEERRRREKERTNTLVDGLRNQLGVARYRPVF